MPSRPGPHTGCHAPFHAPGCPDWVPDGAQFPPRDYVFTLEVHMAAEHEADARAKLAQVVKISYAVKDVAERELHDG